MFIGRTDAEAEARILWPPNERTNSLEKTLMLGKIEGRRRRGRQRVRWLDGINVHEFEQNSRSEVKDREAWHVAVHGVVQTQLSD